ncbi:MAG: hypothetical protein AAB373_06830 [Patescibacteria group bacterium]
MSTKQTNQDDEELSVTTASVSTKKVIYAEIDDEVTAIYDRFKNITGKQIYIVVPQRAILFQSIVNLKILKRKATDDGKTLFLITNDKNGIHLAQKIGIEVYNKAYEGKSALFAAESSDERLRITPLKASINSIEEEAPTRLVERKLSISEILSKVKHSKDLTFAKIKQTERKIFEKARSKFVIVSPNRHALIGLVSLSLIILMIIVYIALPGVTIYLTPTASVLEKSVNITLADSQKNRAELDTHPEHTIASYPISTKVQRTITHQATGKKFSEKGANARGKIMIINKATTARPLITQTRFQTSEGIVFRIKQDVNVPAANAQGPGKLEVNVEADQVDADGLVAGARGNIGPSKFFLPGLKEDSREEVYGESYADMSGGVTDYISYVSKEDLTAAQGRIKDVLLKEAVKDLKVAINQKADLAGIKGEFVLLEGDQAIKLGEVKSQDISGFENKEIGEFSISGEVDVKGVYYDRETMLEILKNELLLKKSPQKELVRINDGSTTYKIFEQDNGGGKIKVTANIKGIEQYEIDPEAESGARILEKIREHIVGLDIDEAKAYVQNLPEINKVEIESWPAWSPTIPTIADNIEFEITDAVNVE